MIYSWRLRIGAIALVLLLGLGLGQSAEADVFKLGIVRLSQDGETGDYLLTASLPLGAATTSDIALPAGCSSLETQQVRTGQSLRLFYRFQCAETPSGAILAPWRLDGARFFNETAGRTEPDSLLPVDGGITIPLTAQAPEARPLADLAETYFLEGILHIWMGWDHLLFVLCLCFLFRGKAMLWLVTLFTVGHSVTLGLSYFGVFGLPIAPVEALIAFSIVLLAREALAVRESDIKVGGQDRDQSALYRYGIVGLFGLLHGLGFASALSELGALDSEKWPALIFFNLGVEFGQIVFVLTLLGLLGLMRGNQLYGGVRTAALAASGCVAGFWVVERVAGF